MIVLDTSGVLVLKDETHSAHPAVADLIAPGTEDLLLSPLVLAECDYMLSSRLGVDAAREFLDEVARGAYELIDLDAGDIAAAIGIIDRYRDLHIGVADASLVVIAARYQTTRLLTLDHRHFRAIAPLWGGPSFTLLPADILPS
jgi:uncharacterized protein